MSEIILSLIQGHEKNGFEFSIDGEKVHVEPSLPPSELEKLRKYKNEIMKILKQAQAMNYFNLSYQISKLADRIGMKHPGYWKLDFLWDQMNDSKGVALYQAAVETTNFMKTIEASLTAPKGQQPVNQPIKKAEPVKQPPKLQPEIRQQSLCEII